MVVRVVGGLVALGLTCSGFRAAESAGESVVLFFVAFALMFVGLCLAFIVLVGPPSGGND